MKKFKSLTNLKKNDFFFKFYKALAYYLISKFPFANEFLFPFQKKMHPRMERILHFLQSLQAIVHALQKNHEGLWSIGGREHSAA